MFQAVVTLPTVCKISLLILIFPQLYWFSIMLIGAFSLFKSHVENSSSGTSKASIKNIDAPSQFAGINGKQNIKSNLL